MMIPQKWLISLLLLATVIAQLHCQGDDNETTAPATEIPKVVSADLSSTDAATTTDTTDSPVTTLATTSKKPPKKVSKNDDDDEEEDSILSNNQKTTYTKEGEDSDDSEDAKETSEKEPLKSNKNDEEDEDEDYEEDSSCDGRLSTFVRSFDTSSFVPGDYETLSEVFKKDGPYFHHKKLEDMLGTLDRLRTILEKQQENKDLKDTGLYISSVLSDKLYEAEVSSQCTADLLALGTGFQNLEPWAFKFIDSVGPPFLSGMLHGHLSHFGQFDQCIGIKSPPQESSNRTVYGKYCTLHFAAITVPVEAVKPEDEVTFRTHPIWKQIIDINKKFSMDKYLHKDFALFISQATDKVDDNIYHAGLCLPSSCSGEEVAKFINAIIYPLTKMSVRIPEALCEPNAELKETKLTDKYQLVAVYIILALSVVVIICTLLDWICIAQESRRKSRELLSSSSSSLPVTVLKNNNKEGNEKENNFNKTNSLEKPTSLVKRIFKSFSLIENCKYLFTSKPQPHHLPAINTTRVLLSVLVFPVSSLGVYLMYYPMMYRHMDGLPRQEMLSIDHWSSWVPGLGFDGLVFVFALLTTLQQFRLLNGAFGEFSYVRYLLGRWIRLAPVLFGSILFIYLLPLSGNGPMWFYNEQHVVAPCKKASSLLSTFLYYSNWNDPLDEYFTRPTLNICNPESWLLSAFNQLYLLAPLLFLALYYWPRFGVLVSTITFLILGPFFTALPRLLTGYPSFIEPTKFISYASAPQAVTHYHLSPLQYVSPLAAGILTGYAILTGPKSKQSSDKWIETFLWLLSLVSVALIFCWQSTFRVVNEDVSTLSVTAFFAYYKLAWSAFLGLTVYLAVTRPKSILGRLFNRPALQPFAKLTTSIYLLRSLVLFYRKTSSRSTEEIYYYKSFQNVIADYLLTALLALLLHLLFEAPTLRILSLFSSSNKAKSSTINGIIIDDQTIATTKDDQDFGAAKNGLE